MYQKMQDLIDCHDDIRRTNVKYSRRRFFFALATLGLVQRTSFASLPLGPAPLNLEEKVRVAEFIFVGLATRVFYVSEGYKEIAPSLEDSRRYTAVLEVRILDPLFPNNMDVSSVDIEHGGGSAVEVHERYVDKLFIYFVSRNEINYPGRKYQYGYTRVPMSAYPEPFERREDVVRLIRVIGKTGPESPREFYQRRGRY